VKQEKLRLLIVDDEEASRYGIRRGLTKPSRPKLRALCCDSNLPT